MAVETQSEFELTVNPTAAERFGFELPQDMLDRAANVIE
jgi:putative ABC transport system substrate-binding protein